MKQKNRIQIFLFGIFFSLIPFVIFGRSTEDIQAFHQKVLMRFADLQKQGKVSDRDELQKFFKIAYEASIVQGIQDKKQAQRCLGITIPGFTKASLDLRRRISHEKILKIPNSDYLKHLVRDMANLKKIVKQKRKNNKNIDLDQQLINSLKQLYRFLKKYRLQIEIVGYHAQIRADWGDMFDLVNKGEDILSVLPSKGIEQLGVKGLKALIRKIERFLDKVDGYEDRLHADWVDLKLANYVLKIELIRLRNAAIFHPLYRGMSMKTCYPK